MRESLPKFVSASLIVSILAGTLFFIAPPKKAEAVIIIDDLISDGLCSLYSSLAGELTDAFGGIVDDAVDTGVGAIGDLIGIGGGSVPVVDDDAITDARKRDCEDFVAKVALGLLKKNILDVMVDQLINWIQYGDNYEPRFITDFGGFIDDAANVAVGDLVQEVGLGAVCKPIKLSLQFALLPQRTFSQRSSCTLDDIVGNVEDFYNNVAGFNFVAYNAVLQPNNNYYGAMLMANDERIQRVADAVNEAQNEIVTGGGFLSQKRCLEWSFRDQNGSIVTTQGATGDNKAPATPAGASGAWRCTEETIVTPGQTIGDTAASLVGVDFQFIINAEDLSAYVAALGDAVLNRLISDTAKGLAGMRKPVSNPTEQGPTGCEGLTGELLNACLSATAGYTSSTTGTYTAAAKQNFEQAVLNIESSEAAAKNYLVILNADIGALQSIIKDQTLQCLDSKLGTSLPEEDQDLVARLMADATTDRGIADGWKTQVAELILAFTKAGGFDARVAAIKAEAADPENANVDDYSRIMSQLIAPLQTDIAKIISQAQTVRSGVEAMTTREKSYALSCNNL